MKTLSNIKALSFVTLMFVLFCCSSDDSSGDSTTPTPTPELLLTGSIAPFAETDVLSFSDSQSVLIKGMNLTANVLVEISNNFEMSLDDSVYSNTLSITKEDANSGNQTVYVRFAPAESAVGPNNGELVFKSTGATSKTLSLSGVGVSITPVITVSNNELEFGEVANATTSSSVELNVNGDNLEGPISLTLTGSFEMSLDNVTFNNTLQIVEANANGDNTVYVRYIASEVGLQTGIITLQNSLTDDVTVSLKGYGLPVTHNYVTFENERLAFGAGYSQSANQIFTLHDDLTNIETINMYVQLRCPSGGCDEWDVYANVLVLDEDSNDWYELGRYITPYWNDNSQLERGFKFDVTDFKSLLVGAAEFKIFTECWNDRGYEVSVDFDYIEGTPDYPYYAIAEVMQYNLNSLEGVPYGVAHSFNLQRNVAVPANSQSTHLRTIISGWGHATPNDADGRGCAEWCYRTHDVIINNTDMFQHNMGPIGCASNPVSNQSPGNWQPDRAGWCPGMEVPIRIDEFSSSMAGSTFAFKYDYEDWTSNGGNGNAFYATSVFVVVKSDTPITKPNVTM